MPNYYNTIDCVKKDMFTAEADLQMKYPESITMRILRLRDMYNWVISNPESKDRQFIDTVMIRYKINKSAAYSDLSIIKSLIPSISAASRDFHRWRFNEMILDTYQMAKTRKDTKSMEKAAAAYAKYNRVDLEDEQAVPYDLIVVQPFTATDDPSVLGIKRIPDLQKKIDSLIEKYRNESMDIEDVDFEEADVDEKTLFGDGTTEQQQGKEGVFQFPATQDAADRG